MTTADSFKTLLVDDDPFCLRLLQRHLQKAGHHVLTATNGREALRLLLAEGPSMIITDWNMPELDGLQLCKAIRSHEGIAFAYVIILTAQEDEWNIVQAFEAGADDFLSKPFKTREMLARVHAGTRIVKLHHDLERNRRELHRFNAEMSLSNDRLAEVNQKLNLVATTDELTGLLNRREAMIRVNDHWSASIRHGDPFACILLDIDHFKSCNDTYGHAVGDLVLQETAEVLRQTARRGESVCRLGGEEFLVICPNTTEPMAEIAAERIRRAVEEHLIDVEPSPPGRGPGEGECTPSPPERGQGEGRSARLRVTVSAGVAERTLTMEGAEDLLRAADAAMYAAKDSGRNIVCKASAPDLSPSPTGRGQGEGSTSEGRQGEDHHPSLLVEMGRGEGTRLPLPQGEGRGEGTLGDGGFPRPTAPLERPKVLVADPDAAIRDQSRTVLAREGYEVVEAVTAAEVFRKAESDGPDVIVLDALLTNSEDQGLLSKLKSDPQTHQIPIIMTSSRRDGRDLASFREAGADEYLRKPSLPLELALRVTTMTRYRRELVRSNAVRGEQSRALDLLLSFSRDVAAAHSLEAVLEATTTAVAAMSCSRRVCVLLPEFGSGDLRVAHALGLDEPVASAIRVPQGAMTSGAVFVHRGKLAYHTPEEARMHHTDPDYDLFPGTPCVFVPLCAPECVVGVLTISGRQKARSFTDADSEYIDLICNIAAATLHDCQTRQARDEARDSIVVALAKLAESRDSDTGRHLERVTRFCELLARELAKLPRYGSLVSDEFLSDLQRAVPLHDIGKVAVPDQILLKPGPLTEEELEVMRSHTDTGAATIRSVIERTPGAHFLSVAEQIAQSHHEWHNGLGYPQGLCGDQIPLPARIAAVADVYDALTSRRVYKGAVAHEQAAANIIGSSGGQFDPDVVAAFQRCQEEFKRLSEELQDSPAETSPHRRGG